MRLGVFFEIFVHKKTKKRHPEGWRIEIYELRFTA